MLTSEAVIGRDPQLATLLLEHPVASAPRIARLRQGTLSVEDLGSTNGT